MPDNADIKDTSSPDWLEGDTKLLKGIREIFIRNAPRQMERLRDAFSSGDIPTAELLSHTLKGSASMIGALSLRDASSCVEKALMDQDIAKAHDSFTIMEREFEKVISELR
jgi:HPt (histidine-containing phosphotransfer) domain-containing protein